MHSLACGCLSCQPSVFLQNWNFLAHHACPPTPGRALWHASDGQLTACVNRDMYPPREWHKLTPGGVKLKEDEEDELAFTYDAELLRAETEPALIKVGGCVAVRGHKDDGGGHLDGGFWLFLVESPPQAADVDFRCDYGQTWKAGQRIIKGRYLELYEGAVAPALSGRWKPTKLL